MKLRGDGLRSPAEVFALLSFVRAGLPASEGPALLFEAGVQTGEPGGEPEGVAGEAGTEGLVAWRVERGSSAAMARAAPGILAALETDEGRCATRYDENYTSIRAGKG